jgi:four helix bundle protein
MQNYHDLIAWQKAHALALEIHRVTREWPIRDQKGLIGQIRRASLSIPSNIAEGAGRASDNEFAKFINIAIGSASETEYQLEFARDAEIAPSAACDALIARTQEVRRILVGLYKRFR